MTKKRDDERRNRRVEFVAAKPLADLYERLILVGSQVSA